MSFSKELSSETTSSETWEEKSLSEFTTSELFSKFYSSPSKAISEILATLSSFDI